MRYIDMRKNQCEVLYEMYKRIGLLYVTPVQAQMIAQFLEKVAHENQREHDVQNLLEELDELFSIMKSTPLPVKREEFENRAILFVFMTNIKEFLQIKYEFAKMHLKDK